MRTSGHKRSYMSLGYCLQVSGTNFSADVVLDRAGAVYYMLLQPSTAGAAYVAPGSYLQANASLPGPSSLVTPSR